MGCSWFLRGQVLACHLYISTCALLVDLDNLLRQLSYEDCCVFCDAGFPYISRPMFFIYPIVCNRMFHKASMPINKIQLSATDLLALASMKNAAKCDK